VRALSGLSHAGLLARDMGMDAAPALLAGIPVDEVGGGDKLLVVLTGLMPRANGRLERV